jgi:hypothetical protein
MRMAFAMAVVSAALIQSAHALDATDTWRGGILVTAVTAACDNPGFPTVGQTLLGVFRPQLMDGDPPGALLVTFNNGALLVTPTGTPGNTGPYQGNLIGGVATFTSYTGGTYALASKPSLDTIDATTPQISITNGKLTKFRNVAGCTVNFKGSFFKGVL